MSEVTIAGATVRDFAAVFGQVLSEIDYDRAEAGLRVLLTDERRQAQYDICEALLTQLACLTEQPLFSEAAHQGMRYSAQVMLILLERRGDVDGVAQLRKDFDLKDRGP